MYAYRELKPRLLAKVRRSFKRFSPTGNNTGEFSLGPVQQLELPGRFDAVITSPPYMNALDYGRDNRLRLWFIDPALAEPVLTMMSRSDERLSLMQFQVWHTKSNRVCVAGDIAFLSSVKN